MKTKMIEKEGIRGKVSNMSDFQRNLLYIIFGSIILGTILLLFQSAQVPAELSEIGANSG